VVLTDPVAGASMPRRPASAS